MSTNEPEAGSAQPSGIGNDSVLAPVATAKKRRRWREFWILAALAAAICIGVVLYTRSAHPIESEPPRDVPHLEGGVIRYSDAFAKRSNLLIVACEIGSLSPVISVTGAVDFDPHLVAAIGSPIEGRVRRILKYPGDHVNEGESVAEVESATLGQIQAGLSAARAHAEAANVNERRETDLAAQHVSSQRDAELAKATASAAKADVLAAEQKIKAIGGGYATEIGVLTLRSPIAGRVVELRVSRGQSIDANSMAVRVADLRQVWIDLAVFDRDLRRIGNEDAVEIALQNGSALLVPGKVAHVGEIIELDTRTARVRVVVDNAQGLLRPGQSVTARIHTAQVAAEKPKVPLEAITSVDGKSVIFVVRSENAVEPRDVVLGAKDATHALVDSGLQPGEQIVTRGAFALKAEIFR